MTKKWTAKDIPPQAGRSIVVTGTGGLGFESALALARAGADVILAGRNPAKGEEAVARIRRAVPRSTVSFEAVDLADLASVAAFGKRLADSRDSLDVLINNAGVMNPPRRKTTADGFELQFGTNYLGHFALTAHLLPLLGRGTRPRVVTLSSIAARQGKIDFDDLQTERPYRPMQAYSQSKLACLMFAFELQRRSDSAGWGIASIAAHPGLSRTDLIPNGVGRISVHGFLHAALGPILLQPAAQGALPTLFAATSPAAKNGGYYGPDRMSETRGLPTDAAPPKRSLDAAVSRRLWNVSEDLAGMNF